MRLLWCSAFVLVLAGVGFAGALTLCGSSGSARAAVLGHEQVRAASGVADGSISLAASDLSPVVGETLTVTFVVSNLGSGALVDPRVELIPVDTTHLNFVSATDGGCAYFSSYGEVICEGADLAAGGQWTASVSLQVVQTGSQVGLVADLTASNDATGPNNDAGVLLWPLPPPSTTTTAVIPPVSLTSTSMPPATIGEPYSTQLTATGGIPPYTFTMGGPNQPPGGLTLSSSGLLSGTPGGIPETITFEIEIYDQQNTLAIGPAIVTPLTLTIQPEPPIPVPPDTTTTTSSTSTPTPTVVVKPHLSLIGTRVISRITRGASQTTDGWFDANEPLKLTLYATRYGSTRRLMLLNASRLGTSASKKAATSLKAAIHKGGSVAFHLTFHKGTLIRGATYVVHLAGTNARGQVATLAIRFRAT